MKSNGAPGNIQVNIDRYAKAPDVTTACWEEQVQYQQAGIDSISPGDTMTAKEILTQHCLVLL